MRPAACPAGCAIALGRVPEVLEAVLEAHRVEPVESYEQLRAVDAWAREAAHRAIGNTVKAGS